MATSAQEQAHFGDKAVRLPAKAAPEAVIRIVRRFVDEREAGEAFRAWMDRVGGANAIAGGAKDLDDFPPPAENPDFYIDWDETRRSPSNSAHRSARDRNSSVDRGDRGRRRCQRA